MAAGPTEPTIQSKWPGLLSLAAHEIRSPLTVVAGYVRMLQRERAGPLTELQRRWLEEADKSCAKMSEVLEEISKLGHREAGKVRFTRSDVDLRTLLADAIAALPELPDRSVTVELDTTDSAGQIHGDAAQLKNALAAIVHALRREVVASDRVQVRVERLAVDGRSVVRIMVGEAERMPRLQALPEQELGAFNECRGGMGLSLPNARFVIEAHGGTVLEPLEDGKASAIVSIPASGSAPF